MKKFLALALLFMDASCGPARTEPDPAPEPVMITSEDLKPVTQVYRDYVAALIKLNSPQMIDRVEGLRKLESLRPYAYFADDRELIARASKGDEPARRELARRGECLNALFAFWGPPNPETWNAARRRIVELGQDAHVVLITVLYRMLLNGQFRAAWPAIRFQLVELGDESLRTAAALLEAKAKTTPATIIFKEDDLNQLGMVVLGFGAKGEAAFETFARADNFNVRKSMVRAIGEARVSERADLAVRMLQSDPEWVVRAQAAWALGRLTAAPDRARAALRTALDGEKDVQVRGYIAEALGTLDDVDAVPELIRALGGGYETVERAMDALRRITGERFSKVSEWTAWFRTRHPEWRERIRKVEGR
ncbi:MAG: HEAT repeat domain-containing protein [Planctomycetes bacterium]|nr:HEAT repeat domain-containing protein [Planctomycetota bacterium]